jgi:voltage-gated potassium channel
MLPLILFAALQQDLSLIGAAAIFSLRLIRLFRLIQLFFRTIKFFEGRRMFYIVAFSVMAVTIGAVVEYLVESTDPEAKITNIEDVFWWAIVTVTTVGYGDVYPVTSGGSSINAYDRRNSYSRYPDFYTWSWTYRIKVYERG